MLNPSSLRIRKPHSGVSLLVQQIFSQHWQVRNWAGENLDSGHKIDVISAFYKLYDFGQIT